MLQHKIKIKKKIKWREKQGKLQRSAQVSEWGNQERAMSGRPNEEASILRRSLLRRRRCSMYQVLQRYKAELKASLDVFDMEFFSVLRTACGRGGGRRVELRSQRVVRGWHMKNRAGQWWQFFHDVNFFSCSISIGFIFVGLILSKTKE